jgi:hypothetical protein
MPSVHRFRRRDPRWEEDGPAARREYHRRRTLDLAAFIASLAAAAAAGGVLALRLGTALIGRG